MGKATMSVKARPFSENKVYFFFFAKHIFMNSVRIALNNDLYNNRRLNVKVSK